MLSGLGDVSSAFLLWLSHIPLDSYMVVAALDALVVLVVLVVLRKWRSNLRQWWWPLPFTIPLLGLALLAALNCQYGYAATLGQLVG